MACLAGTPEEPRPWVQQTRDGRVLAFDGRPCRRTAARTDPWSCAGCVAFRGTDAYGEQHTGLTRDGADWIALSLDERALWERARRAAEDDDDFLPLETLARRMAGEPYGPRSLRGDPFGRGSEDPAVVAAVEWWASYQAEWRRRNPDLARSIARRWRTSPEGRARRTEQQRRRRDRRRAEGL